MICLQGVSSGRFMGQGAGMDGMDGVGSGIEDDGLYGEVLVVWTCDERLDIDIAKGAALAM